MISDELWINGKQIELAPDTVIALTYQVNNVAELKDRQANLSNTIKCPMSAANREALESSEQMTSATTLPYQLLPARVVRNGTDVKGFESAFAIIENADDNYNITIYGGNADFFSTIDGKNLRDLDCSDLDHTFDLATVLAKRNTSSGVRYNVIDFSSDDNMLDDANYLVDMRRLFPCVFISTLIDKIFSAAGFSHAGDIFTNTFYSGLNLNVVDRKAGDTSRLLASAEMQTDYVINGYDPAIFTGPLPINTPIYDPIGIIHFASGAERYVAPVDGTYDFRFTVPYHFTMGSQLRIRLISSVSGTIASDLTNTLGTGILTATYTGLSMNAGDSVFVEIESHPDTSGMQGYTLLYSSNLACIKAVVGTVALGLPYPIACNLPDMKQTDFIKTIMQMFCLLPVTDPASKTVTFVRFDKIRENIPLSQDQDWTDSLDKNQRSMISYRFPGYAQNNWFHYKADKTVSDGYGDGLIVVNDTTLDLTKDQFTLPFAASEDMAWHSQPILKIPLADSSYKIDTEVQPRIFQCYTEDALTSFIQIDYTDGTTTTTITTDVGFAYFSRSGKDENLDFQGSLIPEFYGTITDILSNTKIIDDIFFITESMINSFDPTVPIYLNVSNSIKTISGYFYVNVINNYLPFRPTKVQLIRL